MNNNMVKNTNFSDVFFRWVTFFDTPIDSAKTGNATFDHAKRHITEFTKEEMDYIVRRAKELGLSDGAMADIRKYLRRWQVYKQPEKKKLTRGEKNNSYEKTTASEEPDSYAKHSFDSYSKEKIKNYDK